MERERVKIDGIEKAEGIIRVALRTMLRIRKQEISTTRKIVVFSLDSSHWFTRLKKTRQDSKIALIYFYLGKIVDVLGSATSF